MKRSNPFRLRVWGDNACFTRPEMKVERVSYDVMTPSAARGILEAILWKPAIRWIVTQIDVLKPIKWVSVRRNEVGSVMSPRARELYIEKERQQRAGLFLKDVAYLIHAYFELTERAGPSDNVIKFEQMFLRRAEKGQCYHRPYLGCREFAAYFEIYKKGKALPVPITDTRDLGWMLYDIKHDNSKDGEKGHYCSDKCRPAFFRAIMERGSIRIPHPDSEEVKS